MGDKKQPENKKRKNDGVFVALDEATRHRLDELAFDASNPGDIVTPAEFLRRLLKDSLALKNSTLQS